MSQKPRNEAAKMRHVMMFGERTSTHTTLCVPALCPFLRPRYKGCGSWSQRYVFVKLMIIPTNLARRRQRETTDFKPSSKRIGPYRRMKVSKQRCCLAKLLG